MRTSTPSFSPDSDASIDAYARQAVELGIPELAITDHVDFDPRAPAFAYSTFDERERIVRDAADRWEPLGVTIRFGVELTYERVWEDDIRHHLARHAYDFMIGSVHDRGGLALRRRSRAAWVAGRSLPEIVAPYFDEVEAAARSGLFDAIGHIDFVKRYLAPACHRGGPRGGARADTSGSCSRSSRAGRPSRSTPVACDRRLARRTRPRRSSRGTASSAESA